MLAWSANRGWLTFAMYKLLFSLVSLPKRRTI
jgi:hypothetical protein